MGLQLIIGSSGSGKSYQMYQDMIENSIADVNGKYLAIVPEQYTMETQKTIVTLSPVNGTMNIDILSFDRLAKRIFEEAGRNTLKVLDDTGKCLILRKIIEQNKKELSVFSSKVKMAGFIDEMKSMVSELFQYGIGTQKLEEIIEISKKKPLLYAKMKDIEIIVKKLNEYLKDRFIMNEELLTRVCTLISDSKMINNSYITLDEYTGFSPVQYQLIGLLMKYAKQVSVTVAIRNPLGINFNEVKENNIFSLGIKTINKLLKIAKEENVSVLKPIYSKDFACNQNGICRFKSSKELAHLESNLFLNIPKKYHEDCDNIEIHVCRNHATESEFVAAKIKELVRNEGYRYHEIAVVTADIEEYHRTIYTTFQKLEIPCFIDYKRNIISNPMVESIRAVLEIIQDNYSYESVFRYLRSCMSSLEMNEIDLLENYVLKCGIRGFNRYSKPFKTDDEVIQNAREKLLSDTKDLYQAFHNEESKKNEITIKDAIEALYIFIEKMNMKKKLEDLRLCFVEKNDLSLAKEYGQTYDNITELFDKTVYLVGDERISTKDLVAILDSGFEEIKVGVIPPTIDRVVVGDIERTRLNGVKVLFLVGVNDNLIPKAASKNGVLSQTERTFLKENDIELSPTARENAFIQKYYLYLMLTKMSDKLYLSLKRSNTDGSAARESYLVKVIMNIFEKIKIIDEEENNTYREISKISNISSAKTYIAQNIYDYLSGKHSDLFLDMFCELKSRGVDLSLLIDAAFYQNRETQLSRAVAHAIYGEQLNNSVSRLETFAACAYKHFILYGLSLVERKTFETTNADIGNIYHEALERFAKKIENQKISWNTLDDELRDELIDESINEIKEEYADSAFFDSARNRYLLKRIQKMSKKTVWVLQQQVKAGDFKPESFELRFSSDYNLYQMEYQYSNGKMGLRGVIDRVDYYHDGDDIYIKIIDYKSGNKKFEINDVYEGLQLQLVLYMEAATLMTKKRFPGKKVIPAGLFYYNIDNPVIDKEAIIIDDKNENKQDFKDALSKCILKELKVNGLVNDNEKIIHALDNEMIEGEMSGKSSNVIPVGFTKSGKASAASSGINEKDFQYLMDYVHQKVGELGKEILDGKINVNPYKKQSSSGTQQGTVPCEYCEFQSICGFDKKVKGSSYRILQQKKKEDVLNKIRMQAMKQNSGGKEESFDDKIHE